jgi:hypothetical protein
MLHQRYQELSTDADHIVPGRFDIEDGEHERSVRGSRKLSSRSDASRLLEWQRQRR